MDTIVIYYSYTNNTRKLVNRIKDALQCDSIELEPATPYSTNYDEVVALGQDEKTKNERPALKTNIPDLSSYRKVVLCAPTWWYNIAPVMISFLESYPLQNKNIYILTTNGGFGLGEGKETLKQLCKDSKIQSLIEIPYDEQEMEVSMDIVDNWINEVKEGE